MGNQCKYPRTCSVCGKGMNSGYVIYDSEYFCSDDCLHSRYSEEEYNDVYLMGEGFWTEWEDGE